MPDLQHWLDRWTEDRIGFHEADVNRHLRGWLPSFGLPAGARIFLPLCGKARDMAWLTAQGFEVVGVEISQLAVEAFFTEHEIDYKVSEAGPLRRYRAEGITLLQGDFFALETSDLGSVELVYDRAALIAMAPDERPGYCRHMLDLLPQRPPMLLICLEYDQAEMSGPPYAVAETEVRASYGGDYRIELLARHDIIDESERWREVGLSALSEAVFRLEAVDETAG